MPDTYVALLRGINVGGKNRLPMKDLVSIFTEAGCDHVRSYIQSGNVVFEARATVAATIPKVISAQIAQRYAFKTTLILRTVAEMKKVGRKNPFLKAGVAETELHVLFLAAVPKPDSIETLEHERFLPDSFEVRGKEIYLRLPNGAGRTKLTNDYFDRRLATDSTGRNWRTVMKLIELMGS